MPLPESPSSGPREPKCKRKGHPSQKLGCPFFISAIYPGHCLQAAPGMTMPLVFFSGCAARARPWGASLACRLGRPLGNVPPGRSGPALGVRDRTGQAAFLRSARAGPSTQVGWRQVKVSSTFSKGRYVPVGRCPAADRAGRRDQTPRPSGVARGAAPAFPYFQKRGDVCPPLGVPPRPGVLLVEGASTVPPRPLPGLSASQRAPRPLHLFIGCAG